MDAVNRNIHLLLNSIQKSDVYRTYKKQEAILEKNPGTGLESAAFPVR